jgi:hypothetical protein
MDRSYHEIFLGNGVPTVWLDYTFTPILKAVEQYMMARHAADMVIILEREYGEKNSTTLKAKSNFFLLQMLMSLYTTS